MLRPHRKSKNLILHVEQLTEKEFVHEFKENPQTFPIIAEMVKNRECKFLELLTIRLNAFRVRDLFEVQGTFWTSLRLPCSRCLKDFDSPLTSDFDLTYTQEMPGMTDAFEDKEIGHYGPNFTRPVLDPRAAVENEAEVLACDHAAVSPPG